MQILLISIIPEPDKNNYIGYNHGLGYISAYLKKYTKYSVYVIFIYKLSSDVINKIKGIYPDLVGIYLTTPQYILARKLVESIRCLNIPVVLGGPHPSVSPEDSINIDGVWGVCIGEGEQTMLEIAEVIEGKRDVKEVKNLWYKHNNTIVRNTVGRIIEDLDCLPFPDRSILPYHRISSVYSTNIMGVEFLTSRGCPYTCTYCINHTLSMLCNGKNYFRRRSVDNVIEEIKQFVSTYKYDGLIGFQDDTFTLNIIWIEDFAEKYKRHVGLPFWCNVRVDTLTEDMIRILKSAGCSRVHIGIETGNEWIRNNILKKEFSNDEILQKVYLLHKYKIKVVVFFMLGIPFEQEKDIHASISLCRQIKPVWILYSMFYPFPGTALYTMCVEYGWIDKYFYHNQNITTYYSSEPVFTHPYMSRERLKWLYSNFVMMCKKRSIKIII
jgi:radical SAM superfamily enzyme YgiQ (UPF0313 family)